jgi:hypothetical protein
MEPAYLANPTRPNASMPPSWRRGRAGWPLSSGRRPNVQRSNPNLVGLFSHVASQSHFRIGDSGVTDDVTSKIGSGLVTNTHAYSVVIDGLTRYGLLFATLTLTIFLIAVAAGIIALPTRSPGSLAVAVFVTVAGSAETIHSWKYWSV